MCRVPNYQPVGADSSSLPKKVRDHCFSIVNFICSSFHSCLQQTKSPDGDILDLFMEEDNIIPADIKTAFTPDFNIYAK